jgi:hypothetical protein
MTSLPYVAPLPREGWNISAARLVTQKWDELVLPLRVLWMYFWEYLVLSAKCAWHNKLLFSFKLALKGVYTLGWIHLLTWKQSDPTVLLAMTPHPIVLAAGVKQLPLVLFVLVAIPRMMLPDPINFWFGQRSTGLLQGSPGATGLKQLVNRLESANGRWKMVTLFVLTVAPPPGVPLGPNIYMAAGAVRMKLSWVMTASFMARVVWIALFYAMGSVFNPLGWLGQLFSA